jgi:hypothetical protein
MIRSNARTLGLSAGSASAQWATLLALILAPPAIAQTASFQGLGQMSGAMRGAATFAIGISSDASTIVGYAWVCPTGPSICTSSSKTEALRWTLAGKYQVLGDPGSSIGSIAAAASSRGTVIVGNAPQGTNSFRAFRWTATQGIVALPVSMLFGGKHRDRPESSALFRQSGSGSCEEIDSAQFVICFS